jgi:hypothetical protein
MINSVLTYLESQNIKIINIHIGKTICLVFKCAEITEISDILHNNIPNINIVNMLPSLTGHYHYMFIEK